MPERQATQFPLSNLTAHVSYFFNVRIVVTTFDIICNKPAKKRFPVRFLKNTICGFCHQKTLKCYFSPTKIKFFTLLIFFLCTYKLFVVVRAELNNNCMLKMDMFASKTKLQLFCTLQLFCFVF